MDFASGLGQINPFLIVALLAWSLFWKILAVWRSVKNNQKNWFILFMIPINTVGILEMVYLFKFSKKRLTFEELKNSHFLP